jgi:hypothetical protein
VRPTNLPPTPSHDADMLAAVTNTAPAPAAETLACEMLRIRAAPLMEHGEERRRAGGSRTTATFVPLSDIRV